MNDPTSAEPHPPATPVFDPSVLASLPPVADGSDPAFAREMLDLFQKTSTALLQQVQTHLRSGDVTRLQRALHTLKSSSAQVGGMALSALARQLEAEVKAGRPGQSIWFEQLLRAQQQFQQASAGVGFPPAMVPTTPASTSA